jgi:AraC-like DNA-binding protein
MFHFHAYNPHPMLRHCIDSYLEVLVNLPDGGFIENHFLPNATHSLVFGLDEGNTVYDSTRAEFCATHFLTGPNDSICRVKLFNGLHKLIVHFKPGGLFKIFHFPTSQFNNRSWDAEEIGGKKIAEIAGLLKKSKLTRNIEILDTYLIEQLQGQKKMARNIDEAIELIEKSKGNISLRELELATFTTKRTLERRFLEQVGLYPKAFSRLVRFNSVIRFIESNLNVKWRQLADAFGYYDQSHFIHEFKAFTGSLPQEYFSLKTGYEKMTEA